MYTCLGNPVAAVAVIAAVFASAGCSERSDEPASGAQGSDSTCDTNATSWTLWVPNQGKDIDSLVVLRSHDDEPTDGEQVQADVLATIPVGHVPHNLAFTPDGRLAYVANLSAAGSPGTVSVVDTKARKVIASVTAGKTPHDAAVTPDGRYAWIANIGSDDITVIDTETNQVSGDPIKVGDGPTEITFSLDGKRAFVSNGDAGTMNVVDVEARSVEKTIATGHGAMGIVMTPDGKTVFETDPLDDKVSVVDTATETVAQTLTLNGALVEPHGIELAGKQLLITSFAEESFVVVDSASLLRLGGVVVPDRPWLVAVSPDCTRAYLTLRDSPKVAVIDVETKSLLGLIDLGQGSVHGLAVLRDE